MVEEPSHVKQLFLNHMCKLGLIIIYSIRNYFITVASFTVSPKYKCIVSNVCDCAVALKMMNSTRFKFH
jgi:hypothetical protein